VQNNPLFLETYVPADDEAKFHCIVHCSLDAVEEKGAPGWGARRRTAACWEGAGCGEAGAAAAPVGGASSQGLLEADHAGQTLAQHRCVFQ
jgi:hypothetical protein